MGTVIQERVARQEEKELHKVEQYLAEIGPEKFWLGLPQAIKEYIRVALEKQ